MPHRHYQLFLPLGITISICIALFFYYHMVNDEVARNARDYAREVLSQSCVAVQRSVRDVSTTLEASALALEILHDSTPTKDLAFLSSIAGRNNFKTMGVIYADGTIVSAGEAISGIANNDYVRKGFSGLSGLSPTITRGKGDAVQRVNIFTTPLYQQWKVAGVIFAAYDTEFLATLLASSLFQGKGIFYVVRNDGALVAARRDVAFKKFEEIWSAVSSSQPHGGGMIGEDLKRGRGGSLHFLLDGQGHQAAYEPVGMGDLFVFTIVPDSLIGEEVSHRMSMTVGFMLVMLFLASLLLIHAWHSTRQAEHQAQRIREEAAASRAKSVFLSTISHEIRTPLNAIVGFTHLMGQAELAPVQKEYLRKITVSADALLQIINDVLDFSKIEAGRMELESAPFSLKTVLEAAGSIVGELARSKGIALRMNIDGNIPPVLMGDTTRLTQIVLNLLNNAVKFTSSGEIRLAARAIPDDDGRIPFCPGEAVLLACNIRDTGIGLSQEQVATLFRPFSQADSSTTRRFGGTGLGLAICRQLVHLMGGEISVASELGQGADFHFTVRLAVGEEQALADASALHSPPRHWAGVHVLVVEDNDINQEIIAEVLKGFGLVVDLAGNGQEGMDKAMKNNYALVFMDMQMPVMDGLEAARRLRARGYDPPIVALTANAMLEDKQRCLEAGMSDYLSKPVDMEALRQCLERRLGLPGGDAPSLPDHSENA